MSQDIELEQVVVDRVVIKVGRDDIGRHIVCGMLDRGECVDILPQRQDNDSARMLTGASPYTRTTREKPFDLAVSLCDTLIFEIVLYISVCGLVRHGGDRTGLKGLFVTENNLGIGVCLCLVLSRKVQVNIRFLISFESQEGLEGDIKAVLVQFFSASGALHAGHIDAAFPLVLSDQFGVKICVVAVCAVIVGREGVDLCDPRHGRYK